MNALSVDELELGNRLKNVRYRICCFNSVCLKFKTSNSDAPIFGHKIKRFEPSQSLAKCHFLSNSFHSVKRDAVSIHKDGGNMTLA